jgi:hypothetical protein
MTRKTKSGTFLIRFFIVSFFEGTIYACLDLDPDQNTVFPVLRIQFFKLIWIQNLESQKLKEIQLKQKIYFFFFQKMKFTYR